MRITLDEITSRVAVMLCEPDLPICEPADSPFPSLRENVALRVGPTADEAILAAPIESLDGWKDLPDGGLAPTGDDGASLPLPADFLRLVALRLSGWKRNVTDAIPPGHWLARAHTLSPPLQASDERPLAVLSPDSSGWRLRLYPAREGASIRLALYMPRTRVAADGSLELPEKIATALPELLAQKILASRSSAMIR